MGRHHLPWLVVYRVTWERPEFAGRAEIGFVEGARRLAAHGSYRRLVGLYLCARIAVDIVGAMFLFYFTYWLNRPGDFPITMSILLITVVLSLPIWLRVARHTDKRTLFIFGCCWWIVAQIFIASLQPDWPRWTIFVIAGLAGIGYAVADLMPWAMLGDVIDEDELETGERREGIYAGFLTFLRKLGGATGVFIAGVALDLAGFVGGREQSPGTLDSIRGLTSLAPALFLALGAYIAIGYPLTRTRHDAIRKALEGRQS
jgi:GPH family glycoside/pentoside/hexuronide:cation symporter